MDRKMPMFAGGAVGAIVFFAILLGRNWGAIGRLQELAGAKGLVVVIAGSVLVAALTGLLTLLVQPANFLGAMLFGFVPPALLVVVGVPRGGLPERSPGASLKESLGEKKVMAFAVWTGLNPIATIADLETDRALAGQRDAMASALDRAASDAKNEMAQQSMAAMNEAAAKAKQAQEAAIAAERDRGAAALKAAVAAAKAEMQGAVDAANAQVAEARRRRTEAETQTQTFQSEVQELRSKLAAATSSAGDVGTIRAELEELRKQSTEAVARATQAEAAMADLDRLAGWYLTDAPSSSARLFNVCVARLRDRDPANRAAACRLLVRCGREAVPQLEKALNDSDASVAQAALQSLDALGQ